MKFLLILIIWPGQWILTFSFICLCGISNSLEIWVVKKAWFSHLTHVFTKPTHGQMGWSRNQSTGSRSLPFELLICRCTQPFRKKTVKQLEARLQDLLMLAPPKKVSVKWMSNPTCDQRLLDRLFLAVLDRFFGHF